MRNSLTEEARKRLSALNKGALKGLPEVVSARELRDRQAADRAVPSIREVPSEPAHQCAQPASLPPPPEDHALESIAPGDLTPAAGGRFWLINRGLSSLWDKAREFHCEYCRTFDGTAAAGFLPRCHPDWKGILECGPKEFCYLDIETCGFSGTPVFLVGVFHADDQDFWLKQFFARDYSEEGPMLNALWEFLARFRAVVTFNGKSFDLPFLTERAFYHRVPVHGDLYHFDLLHESRRRWKKGLPDCKLQTLERYICRRSRTGDIPGAQIPLAYHEYVQTGDATAIRDILHHNALDLLTLAEIALFALQERDIWE